jgi:hypothetical protein
MTRRACREEGLLVHGLGHGLGIAAVGAWNYAGQGLELDWPIAGNEFNDFTIQQLG